MLDKQIADKVLEAGKSTGADYVEIFAEQSYRSSLALLSSEVENCQSGIDAGVGVRLVFGEQVYYGYTNSMEEADLIALVFAQKRGRGEGAAVPALRQLEINQVHPCLEGLDRDVPIPEKIEFLRLLDQFARREDRERVAQVRAGVNQTRQRIQVFTSEGTMAEETRNYIRCILSVIATDGSRQSQAYEGPGALKGWEFVRSLNPEELAGMVGKRALVKLGARSCPGGNFPVVLQSGFGGVIFHEACGHALETTAVAKKASVFADRLGEPIASSCLSVVDDGTLQGEWGSSAFDDEGMPTQRTQLIKDGILKSYMVDLVGSIQTGYARTGSGRRQSYRYAPASRMRNTYIEAGPCSVGELIASIPYGLYAHKMGGGSVSPGTGEFNFSVDEAYIIRDGKVAEPVRSATLIGSGAEVIQKISMVADNLELGEGICGSVSGNIPVTVGQPAIKVDQILVGGDEE